jgi:enamine deaminase RidA (YjgF/YER057c/UK114 family)
MQIIGNYPSILALEEGQALEKSRCLSKTATRFFVSRASRASAALLFAYFLVSKSRKWAWLTKMNHIHRLSIRLKNKNCRVECKSSLFKYMQQRIIITTGAPWESIVGYCRAVQIGNTIEVSGTVAADENGPVAVGDPAAQTRYVLEKIQKVLENAGFSLSDVVRTRMFVTNIDQWEAIGRTHGAFFAEIKPCTTMVEVSRLIAPEYLVEIEATAVRT